MRVTLIALALTLALTLTGCGRAHGPTHEPLAESPTLEQLYLDRRYGEVVLLAASVLEAESDDRERVAEARFFRALAWLAQDPRGKPARALLDLRKLEFEHPDLLWGRLAALHVAALTHVDVLQATLVELAVERRDLQVRIEGLEQVLAELQAERSKREADLAALTRDRNDLQEQLEDELAGLKQIDMQREP